MRKSDAKRFQARSARLARLQRQQAPVNPHKPLRIPIRQPWWQSLSRHGQAWWKWGGSASLVFASVYAAFPHFSIARETTNSFDPYVADFIFKNNGWLPATQVQVKCEMSVNLQGNIHIGNSSSISYVSNIVWGSGEFTESCHVLSAAGLAPTSKGKVLMSAEYTFLYIPYRFFSAKAFSFRYDSRSGGFVYVPDIP
jgi:hypothetical protein